MERKIRVRFAPSPTGPLHIGGVRTALYNYLFARRLGGDFILRIEDTDTNRFVPGAEDYIVESLRWCGIETDESPSQGGPHAPYRQSERREIYWPYAQQLVESGHAYYAFDTPEQLDQMRMDAEMRGDVFSYNHALREKTENSLRMSACEVDERKRRGDQWVIRFKMPANEIITMRDLIRGDMEVNTSTLDDKVLFKSADELPTYHLANIVDDHLMEISHVIRGEEWLPSLPLHYLLYRAFGWSKKQPRFAHLPLLLKPAGKGKLSKRDGDRMGFPVFPLTWETAEGEHYPGYREAGYFPEAFVNLLALLGWNPGTEQEIFSMEELITAFSLDRVGKSGARFDPEKAKWFNAQYLRAKSDEELGALFLPILREEHGADVCIFMAARVAALVKERAQFVSDFRELSSFIFLAPKNYDENYVEKYWRDDTPAHIAELSALLAGVGDFTAEKSEKIVKEWIAEKGYNTGRIMNAFRLCMVGEAKGPSLFEIAELIGKEETLKRIDFALEKLQI